MPQHERNHWSCTRSLCPNFEKLRHVDGPTVKAIWHDQLKDMRERYGAKLRCVRHGELHTGLLEHLKATEGHPVEINPETEIADIDCERGIIRTSDGSEVEKDLIVLANGLGVRILALIEMMVELS